MSGFTLIEIMVVVIIIGIIGALFVPNIMGRGDQARRVAVDSDLRSIATTLELYRLDNSRYPSTDQGLEALVSKPGGFPEGCPICPAMMLDQLRSMATRLVNAEPLPPEFQIHWFDDVDTEDETD